jgi:hypothetical protein
MEIDENLKIQIAIVNNKELFNELHDIFSEGIKMMIAETLDEEGISYRRNGNWIITELRINMVERIDTWNRENDNEWHKETERDWYLPQLYLNKAIAKIDFHIIFKDIFNKRE